MYSAVAWGACANRNWFLSIQRTRGKGNIWYTTQPAAEHSLVACPTTQNGKIQKGHSLWHKQAKVREKHFTAKQDREFQSLNRPRPVPSSSPHQSTSENETFPKQSCSCGFFKKCRPTAKHSPMNLCMSYFSKGTRIASKWNTPAQLEPGRQSWLLTFRSLCTGRGRSTRKGSFTLVQGLHYSGQKPVTDFNK